MKKFNAFFVIGTLGMLLTSLLHILMAGLSSDELASNSFWVLYPVFVGFLIVGTVVMMKRQPLRKK